MHMFDASAIIHGWDNYPIAQFPRLWAWLGSQISAKLVVISETAYQEVNLNSPDCWNWLKGQNVTVVVNIPCVLQLATTIKSSLGIVGDNYHQLGVCENDILIIASAKVGGATLVSDENKQPSLPTERRRYKIPAVCASLNTPVPCQSFLQYIVSSGQSF